MISKLKTRPLYIFAAVMGILSLAAQLDRLCYQEINGKLAGTWLDLNVFHDGSREPTRIERNSLANRGDEVWPVIRDADRKILDVFPTTDFEGKYDPALPPLQQAAVEAVATAMAERMEARRDSILSDTGMGRCADSPYMARYSDDLPGIPGRLSRAATRQDLLAGCLNKASEFPDHNPYRMRKPGIEALKRYITAEETLAGQAAADAREYSSLLKRILGKKTLQTPGLSSGS